MLKKFLIAILLVFILSSCSRLTKNQPTNISFDYYIPDIKKTYSYTCKGYNIDEFSIEWEKGNIENTYIQYNIDDYFDRADTTFMIDGNDLLCLGFHDPYADFSYSIEGKDIVFRQAIPGDIWESNYVMVSPGDFEDEREERTIRYEFIGFEYIDVLGTQYNAARILSGELIGDTTKWYIKGLGVVKSSTIGEDGIEKYSYELVSVSDKE